MMAGVTVILSDQEDAALEELAAFNNMNKAQLLKQSLKLYSMIDRRVRGGERLAFVDNNGTPIRESIPEFGG
jgi:predicted transcriptional regulator